MTLARTNPDDLIQSEICGEKIKRLERHLYWKHNMTCSEYQDLTNYNKLQKARDKDEQMLREYKKYLFEIKSIKSGKRFGSTINLNDKEKHLTAYHYSLINNLVFCLVNKNVILSDSSPLTFYDLVENTAVKLDDIV